MNDNLEYLNRAAEDAGAEYGQVSARVLGWLSGDIDEADWREAVDRAVESIRRDREARP